MTKSLDHITTIFFDLDHTLWDFDRNSKLAFEQLFIKHAISLKVEDFLKVYEPLNFEFWKLYREDKISKTELRRMRFSEALEPFGIQFDLPMIDQLATDYIDELPKNNYLFEGVVDLLDYLQANYTLHIITNGFEEVQRLKLINSGIRPYFETVTTSEEAGVKKPNPKIFRIALEKAASDSQQSIMIGDTFEADILGAEAVGMHTLFYNYRNDTIPDKYLVIDDISAVRKYL